MSDCREKDCSPNYQRLINALTGQVSSSTQMSVKPTNHALGKGLDGPDET
jgi:hypothetical protein